MASLEAAGIEIRWGRSTYRTTCPSCSQDRHKTHDRCLAVNLDKQVAKCHHCGAAWVAITGRDGYGSAPQRTYRKPDYEPAYEPTDETTRALERLATDRGIPVAVGRAARIEARHVWMQPGRDGGKGREEWVYAAPYTRDGEIVNVKYRTAKDKRFRMEKDAELCLYGLDDIEPGETLVWVEGEWDKLSVAAAGIWSCVSVPNGAPPPNATNYEREFDFLAADFALVNSCVDHIIAVDDDQPGHRLRDELIRRLGPECCRVVQWPEGIKDANDMLRLKGADALRALLLAARPVPVEGLVGVDELAERIDTLYRDGLRPGEHPGNDRLALHYRVRPGELTVVTGVPSHGKSAWVDWVLHNLMARSDWRVAICSPENQPLERHAASLIQLAVGKPFGEGPSPRMSPEEMAEGRDWLADHAWFILPEEDLTIDGILRRAKAAIYRHGVRGVVIDPWNEIEHQRDPGMTETEYISLTLTTIRNFARRHQVHVWIVAHPTKLQRDREGNYPVPTLYDISGSARWRDKCDMGVVIWRDVLDPDGAVQVHIAKVRFRENGEPGMVEFFFDRATGRYTDVGPVTHRYTGERDDDDFAAFA